MRQRRLRNASRPGRSWPERRRCRDGSPSPGGRCATDGRCHPGGAGHRRVLRSDAPGPSTPSTPHGCARSATGCPTGHRRSRPTGRCGAPPSPTGSRRRPDEQSRSSHGPSRPHTPHNAAATRQDAADERSSDTNSRTRGARPRQTTPKPTHAGHPRTALSGRPRTGPTDQGRWNAAPPEHARLSRRTGSSCGHDPNAGRWPRSTTPA